MFYDFCNFNSRAGETRYLGQLRRKKFVPIGKLAQISKVNPYPCTYGVYQLGTICTRVHVSSNGICCNMVLRCWHTVRKEGRSVNKECTHGWWVIMAIACYAVILIILQGLHCVVIRGATRVDPDARLIAISHVMYRHVCIHVQCTLYIAHCISISWYHDIIHCTRRQDV